jgi:hypothetical protein
MGEKRKKLDAFSQLLVAIGAAILANGAINQMPPTAQLFVFLMAMIALIGGLWMFAVLRDFIPLNLQPKWYLRQPLEVLSEIESKDVQDDDDGVLGAFNVRSSALELPDRKRRKRQKQLQLLEHALERTSFLDRIKRGFSKQWKS